MIRELGLDCEGCEDFGLVASGLPEGVECSAAPQMIIRIGLTGGKMECARPLVLSEPTVEIYDRLP
jgi:hypothetical protein